MISEKIAISISWLMLYALASLAVPILPTNAFLYYIALVAVAVYALFSRQNRTSFGMILILVACILSIVLNNPPTLFKSWERLGLFSLMLIVASPLCQNKNINSFRLQLFNKVMIMMLFITGGSCIAYFLGIDFTIRPKGVTNLFFGGIAGNSMLLAVCAGLSIIYTLNWLLAKQYGEKHRKLRITGICLLMLASFLCLLLSGSRGAALSTIISMLFLLYKQHRKSFSKFLIYIVTLSLLGIVTFTFWEPYTKALVEKQKGNDVSGSATASRDDKWEARISEFKSSPFFGVGFSAVDLKYKNDYIAAGGIVETGTSWGGMLSMIGLLGIIPFVCLYARSLWFLFTDDVYPHLSGLLATVLCWFSVHMIVEGYILAGGSFICFIVWLVIGAANAYRNQVYPKKEEVQDEVTV